MAGHSAGGAVLFEAASQLHAEGLRISCLCLLDAVPWPRTSVAAASWPATEMGCSSWMV